MSQTSCSPCRKLWAGPSCWWEPVLRYLRWVAIKREIRNKSLTWLSRAVAALRRRFHSRNKDPWTRGGGNKVGQLAIICEFVNQKISLLAHFKRPDLMLKVKAMGCIDGRCGKSFGGRKTHLQARQREHERHGSNRRRSGIEVGSQHQGHAELDHLSGGRVVSAAQGKHRPRQEHGLHARVLQLEQRLIRDGLKMIGGCSAKFRSQRSSGTGSKLFGVYPQSHSVVLCRGQHSARFVHGEGVIIAEGNAVARQSCRRDFGDEFFGYRTNIFLSPIGELWRHGVSGQQCRNDASRSLIIESRQHAQHAQFCFAIETVAGFRFEGCCAPAQHPVAMS